MVDQLGAYGNTLGRHEEDLAEDHEDREKWIGLSYILEVELTVLASGLDAEDEGREVMENVWVSGSINFVDRLWFAKLVPWTQGEETGFGNRVEEKMMSSALVLLSLEWHIQMERPSQSLAIKIWHMRKAIGAGGSDWRVINM